MFTSHALQVSCKTAEAINEWIIYDKTQLPETISICTVRINDVCTVRLMFVQ